MPKLTQAQRTILERMAKGVNLIHRGSTSWVGNAKCSTATLAAMQQAGLVYYISESDYKSGGDVYVISSAGRAALSPKKEQVDGERTDNREHEGSRKADKH
jgi:hypothetical protein